MSVLEMSKVIAGGSLPRASGPLPAYSWTLHNAKQKLVVFLRKVFHRLISHPQMIRCFLWNPNCSNSFLFGWLVFGVGD